MKILFVTSECAPFSKSGGLADVAFSLPPALARNNHQVEIITPLYQCVKKRFMDQLEKKADLFIRLGNETLPCGLWRGLNCGVPIWFIENDGLFDRPKLYGYDDDKFRFAWFSKAVVDTIRMLDFYPEILHCNDWETALAIIYLKDHQAVYNDLLDIKTVYTIHNIAYQGQFGEKELTSTFALPEGWYGGGLGYEFEGRRDVNLMKGAMLMADAVSTVSPTYANELHDPKFGKGLQGVCDIIEGKLYGILNGIDMNHYDPMLDDRIISKFNTETVHIGKAECKADIQNIFGLNQEKHWPLLCSVARLVEQKGIELIKQILPQLMEMGVQIIVFGQGEQKYIDYFNDCVKRWPGQFGFSSNYSEEMAAKVFAGSDFYLMPSAFEPCGLSQMMAMRYGTIPIVHETGGLKDSIRPYSDFDGIGDGFSFANYTGKDLFLAIQHAVKLYFADKKTFNKLRYRDMTKDFSWDKSAFSYERMYSDIMGQNSAADQVVSFQDAYDILKVIYGDLKPEQDKFLAEQPDGYSRIISITITGPGQGSLYVKFTKENGLEMQPFLYKDADCFITSSMHNLYGMATGTISMELLFVNGQLKIAGNISKGFDIRYLLCPEETED